MRRLFLGGGDGSAGGGFFDSDRLIAVAFHCVSRLANNRLRHDGGCGSHGAGEHFLAVGSGFGRHAPISERLIPEGKHGIQRCTLEGWFPVVGRTSGFVKVDPFPVGTRPSGAQNDVAMVNIEQVARVKI
jgi:hypothetical protein